MAKDTFKAPNARSAHQVKGFSWGLFLSDERAVGFNS